MKPIKPESIKTTTDIYRNGNYIIIAGRSLHIFDIYGNFVAGRPDIRTPVKVSFIRDDRLLVDANRFYYFISLADGTDIWKSARRTNSYFPDKFAISNDESYAYDYYNGKIEMCVVRINLLTGKLSEVAFFPELHTTNDIICCDDEEGEEIPCLLQRHYCSISGKQISENGILYQYQDPFKGGRSYYWKAKWTYPGSRISNAFFCNSDTVITNDLLIHNVKTGEQYSLVENEEEWTPPENSFHECVPYIDRGYVVLVYDRCNVVVDYIKRKVIACYASDRITKGCIINDQYWIGTTKGVFRKPFPMMEEIPPKPAFSFI